MKRHEITEQQLRESEFAMTLFSSCSVNTKHKALRGRCNLLTYAVSYEILQDGEPIRVFTDPREAVEYYNSLP